MATGHRVGEEAELCDRGQTDRHRIPIFHRDGQFRSISELRNDCRRPVRGELVMCPWHAWEYSVVIGKVQASYDKE
jgi:nitrite reductase/ring-hydroxylating ferredoxin subunit